jgi:hypothetical protein
MEVAVVVHEAWCRIDGRGEDRELGMLVDDNGLSFLLAPDLLVLGVILYLRSVLRLFFSFLPNLLALNDSSMILRAKGILLYNSPPARVENRDQTKILGPG